MWTGRRCGVLVEVGCAGVTRRLVHVTSVWHWFFARLLRLSVGFFNVMQQVVTIEYVTPLFIVTNRQIFNKLFDEYNIGFWTFYLFWIFFSSKTSKFIKFSNPIAQITLFWIWFRLFVSCNKFIMFVCIQNDSMTWFNICIFFFNRNCFFCVYIFNLVIFVRLFFNGDFHALFCFSIILFFHLIFVFLSLFSLFFMNLGSYNFSYYVVFFNFQFSSPLCLCISHKVRDLPSRWPVRTLWEKGHDSFPSKKLIKYTVYVCFGSVSLAVQKRSTKKENKTTKRNL